MDKIIEEELEESLCNLLEYDFNDIKDNIEKVLSQHKNEFQTYKVVCDQTNNPPNVKHMSADIYIQPKHTMGYMVNNITILPDRIKALRKLRKKKLEKLYGKL